MKSFRFLSAFSFAAAVFCSAAASTARSFERATESIFEVAALIVDLLAVAFPMRDRPALSEVGLPRVRVLGRVQTRSFRSRLLARQSDGRSRAPLAAAFVPA